jgi:UMF1 family MFS transporter
MIGLQSSPRTRGLTWALLDGAREPFFTVVLSIVFPPLFVGTIAADPATGTAMWGYALSISALLLVVLAPIAGVIASRTPQPKAWMSMLFLIAGVALAALWLATAPPALPLQVLALCIVAYVAIELTRVFSDSLLGVAAGPAGVGRLSGLGVGLGFFAAFVFLGAMALEARFGLIGAESATLGRAASAATGVWLVLLAIPFLVLFPASPSVRTEAVGRPAHSMYEGLRGAVALLIADRQLVRFLLARMVYWDGTMALFAFLAIVAATSLGWGSAQLTTFGLFGLLGGAAAGFLSGRADARRGARGTITLALVVLVACTLTLLFLASTAGDSNVSDSATHRTSQLFLGVGVAASVCLGMIMSSSRALLVRIAPAGRLGEYFGLYVMIGRASSFVAPLLVALATSATGSERTGVFSVSLCLLVGGVILLQRVRPC